MGRRTLLILLIILVPRAATAGATDPPARVLAQSAHAFGADGRELPAREIDPAGLGGLTDLDFELGRGRLLRLRTNLPPDRRAGADALAARVDRCYRHLEAATGRRVEGGILLYLLGFDPVPAAFSFRAELADAATWNQVRLALLGPGETLAGPDVSAQLSELLLDTLPHELAHRLLDVRPTVRQDLDDAPPTGTRWFVEGVCESLAKGFAAAEDPAAARELLALRDVERVMSRPSSRTRLLSWHAGSDLSWEQESRAYGAALLLVRIWEEARPLPALLADLADTGGDHDGGALLGRLCADTGLSVLAAMERADALGRRRLRPLEVTHLAPPRSTKTDGPSVDGPPALSSGRASP